MLLNQNEIIGILKKVLPKTSEEDIRKAAEALTVAAGNWQEVDLKETFGASYSIQCKDICALGEAFDKGQEIKAFIKK
ncbi:MAG: hypothetical protein A2787_03085 [Omnitrophica WOR_2 bacterium RIFCSPHIGHO2_01_FULL_48_9]|nr:MAG: hypothetical protein A3D10_09335 [Omnitrophica WOR_2 bacterium RIFCSPHIGHO2_02_FULL_48_11]OGX31443.1 MAG: hypothetical protein A2787_03085 [Omnitrophica WOR_2 bacterium RIFCSPHIGHO2_01_FULL_48_9]